MLSYNVILVMLIVSSSASALKCWQGGPPSEAPGTESQKDCTATAKACSNNTAYGITSYSCQDQEFVDATAKNGCKLVESVTICNCDTDYCNSHYASVEEREQDQAQKSFEPLVLRTEKCYNVSSVEYCIYKKADCSSASTQYVIQSGILIFLSILIEAMMS